MKITKKSDCPFFKPMPTNPEACAKWVRPVRGEPFCVADTVCPTLGLRLAPRADQEEDSFE